MRLVTLVTPGYLPGLQALGKSLKAHGDCTGWPLTVVCEGVPASEVFRCLGYHPRAEHFGTTPLTAWAGPITVMHVGDLGPRLDIPDPRGDGGPYKSYRAVQAKLALWRLPDDESCLYLDADCLVLGSLKPLEAVSPLALARDDNGWDDGSGSAWNSGVMLFRPHAAVAEELAELAPKAIVKDRLGDQGVLNVWIERYGVPVQELPYGYNVLKRPVQLGRVALADVKILHFAGRKPWHAGGDRPYRALEQFWWREYDR